MLLDYLRNNCKYNIPRLKNEVILTSDLEEKNIIIDSGGEAYVNGITGLPLVIDCYDVEYNEESTINGRYLYEKTVSFSVQGYKTPNDVFGARRRVIIVTENNEYRLVNVDFPAKMTYTYSLDNDNSFTRFTFHSYSNFPTLKVVHNFKNAERFCAYGYDGSDKLKMNYVNSAKLDRVSGIVTTNGDEFLSVEPDSYSFTEEYNGDEYIDTLTINLPISDYRSSWHYNLEEFKKNRYNAIITTKNGFNIFSGFNFGLFPTYAATAGRDSQSITVTLAERSNVGSVGFDSYTMASNTNTKWANVDWYLNDSLYDCAGDGLAEYVLQMGVDIFGNPTGVYRCKEGMQNYFEEEYGLVITETFEASKTFPMEECVELNCDLVSDIPQTIIFHGVQTKTYTIFSNCAWNIANVPSGIIIDTLGGAGGNTYQLTIQNIDATERNGMFSINHGNTIDIVTFKVVSSNFVTPTSQTINCLSQTVTFFHSNENCNVTVEGEEGIVANIDYGIGQFNITVPNNITTSSITYTFTVTDCNNNEQTIYIYQNQRYEDWRRLFNEYVCESGSTCELLTLFTGTTSENMVETAEKKKGEIISGSTLCSDVYDRWYFNGQYICQGDAKYQLLEHQISYDNVNWTSDGEYQIGEYVGEDATYCSNVQYRWTLTDDIICEDNI